MNLFDLSRFDKAQCVLFFIYCTLKQNCDPKPKKFCIFPGPPLLLLLFSLSPSLTPSPEFPCCSFQTCRNHCLGKKKWVDGNKAGLRICHSISNPHNLGHKTTWAEQSHLKGILDFIFLRGSSESRTRYQLPRLMGRGDLAWEHQGRALVTVHAWFHFCSSFKKNTFVDCLKVFTEKCMQFAITQAFGKWKVQILITHCSR